MTATQAPTPGPLSGDFSVEEYVAEYEFRGDEGSHTPNDDERALITDAIHGYLSEASYRLAPTAPVEASGSFGLAANEIGAHIAKRDAEYEAALADLTIKPDASNLEEFSRSIFGALSDCPAMSLDKQADFVARALWPVVSALRPQPSGETRKAVAWIDPTDIDHVAEGHPLTTTLFPYAKDGATMPLYARPLALGGQHSGGDAAWKEAVLKACENAGMMSEAFAWGGDKTGWGCVFEFIGALARGRFVSPLREDTTPARAEAQDEGALSILDCLLDHSGARGSFDAMRHGDAVKDAEELLRSARSPGHTDLMVTPESIDAYMKDNPMEAKDEGAAGEIKSCPFCGGEAEIIHLDDDDNAGGSCVCCTKCQASGNVEFGRKENFVENWNRRSHPSPPPAADADRVRIAVEALEWIDSNKSIAPVWVQRKVRDTLAALKSTAATEKTDV